MANVSFSRRCRGIKEIDITKEVYMHNRNALIVLLPYVLLFLSCGSGDAIKKGDRFEALVELQEVADIQGDMEYSDGFTCTIPTGTVLVALYPASSGFFECKPVVVNATTNTEEIQKLLVPEMVRKKSGFKDFSLTLSVEYIGTKIKRM